MFWLAESSSHSIPDPGRVHPLQRGDQSLRTQVELLAAETDCERLARQSEVKIHVPLMQVELVNEHVRDGVLVDRRRLRPGLPQHAGVLSFDEYTNPVPRIPAKVCSQLRENIILRAATTEVEALLQLTPQPQAAAHLQLLRLARGCFRIDGGERQCHRRHRNKATPDRHHYLPAILVEELAV